MKHFSKVLLGVALLLGFPTLLLGQLSLEEIFNTPTTDITTVGWSNVTNIGSTTSGPPYILVTAGTALVYPGYFESGAGNSAYLIGYGQDAQISFSSTPSTGSVYVAFMLKVDSVSTDGDYFWMVRNSSNHNRWRGWAKRTVLGEDSCYFGVSKGGTAGASSYSTKKFKLGGTHLLVAKYDFNTTSTTDALLSLWVDPDITSFGKTEDPNPIVKNYSEAATSDYTSPTINRFVIIQNTAGISPTYWIGGIRLGLTWADVIPMPPVYYKGTGDITSVGNWGTNVDGSGTSPSNFAGSNVFYFVKNTAAVSLATTWTISGTNSKIIIGSGVNFTVVAGAGAIVAPKVDVASGGTLTFQESFFWPTFGSIAGTVALDNAAGITLDADYTFPGGGGYFDLKNGDLDLGGFTLTVKGRIRCNANKVKGTGTFKLDSAGTIAICSPNGITQTAPSGDIQSTVRQYHRYGTYNFQGTTHQVTGDAIPDTVAVLGINMANKANTVALSKKVSIAPGNLDLTRGKLKLGSFDMLFTTPNGQSDSSYVLTDGTGSLIRYVSTTTTSAKTMPLGSSTEYRKAAVTFVGTVTNALNLFARYVAADPGSAGLPAEVVKYYHGGYWIITGDADPVVSFRLDLGVANVGLDSTKMRILWRPNSSTAWTYAGSTSGYLNGTLTELGIPTLGQFAVAECVGTPPQAGNRYQAEIFANQVILSDQTYGTSPAPSSKTLTYDLYTASGDVATNRPLVIFIHGGGFTGGDKVSNYGSYVCAGLARRGYVVASINYRTASGSFATDSAHFEAMMKALQDAKAAVRFFRKNFVTYGIDSSQIYVTGSSAGSITALHLAYLDSSEIPYKVWTNINGTFEGLSGTAGVSSRVQGVISCWGAIGDTAWMKAGNPPVYFVHGTSDVTVLYDGNPSTPADGPFKYGSKYMYEHAQNLGLVTGLRPFYNTGHTLDNNLTKQDSAYRDFSTWLASILKPGTITGIAENNLASIPTVFNLQQNYPNPFNPATTIQFDLPVNMKVSLIVYNILGQQVANLADGVKPAGSYSVVFDATRLASGLYFYQLSAGSFVQTKKMMLLK